MEPQVRSCTTSDGVTIAYAVEGGGPVVRGTARSSAGVEFEDRGEQEAEGVGKPVRVYAVRVERA